MRCSMLLQVCSVLEKEGCTSAEWLAEIQTKTATELEQLIAAAMALDDGIDDNVTSASGAAQDAGHHAHSQWILPDAANTQLKNAQQNADEQALQTWSPKIVEIDHEVCQLPCSSRVPYCCLASDLVRRNHVRRSMVEPPGEFREKAPRSTACTHGDATSLPCFARLWRCRRCQS